MTNQGISHDRQAISLTSQSFVFDINSSNRASNCSPKQAAMSEAHIPIAPAAARLA
jgi:hypothetical protein